MIITRRFEFDAGHRVLGHEGKCANLHGHRYVVDIGVAASGLDSIGRIIDFGVVKQLVGSWIDAELDHNMLLHADDPLMFDIEGDIAEIVGRQPFIMPDGNPTAENIAKLIFDKAVELLPAHIQVKQVRVWETPNCWADYEG